METLVKPPIVLNTTEFPTEFRVVPETIGNLEACSLLWYLPAFQIRHIPAKPARLLKRDVIKREYTGANQASLSVKLKLMYDQVKKEYDAPNEKVDLSKNIYINQVAEKCGTSVALKLLEHFPGSALHIPRKGKYIMLKKMVQNEFDGQNQVELAVKYSLSIACVYRYLKSNLEAGYTSIDGIKFKQLSLF